MENYKNERLLIISNNVLSTTRNNGKTIYSYIDSLPKGIVAQLYFNAERPVISGYSYYQITDKDIIRGIISPQKRGRQIKVFPENFREVTTSSGKYRNDFFRIIRELLWFGKWKSKQLLAWLDAFSPTTVFFVGGDSGFAYDIYEYIVKRYAAKSSLYITDDYIMPRKKEAFLGKLRRLYIKQKITKALTITNMFFTVSPAMKKEYLGVFGRDSETIVNLTESLRLELNDSQNEYITLVYAGSLYYGRDIMLGKIASVIKQYNQETTAKKAMLNVYTNTEPDELVKSRFVLEGCSSYCGSLSKEELKVALNRADILVFVESFDEEQIEKTRYSLSTKVPEYLSVGKPILAVGPNNIGSMDHLADVSCCVNDLEKLDKQLFALLDDIHFQKWLSEEALEKYNRCHDYERLQHEFMKKLFENRK